jgi:hypothetical protein
LYVAAPYCFGEVRVATLALLIFTALSGWRSCGVVITKLSDHVVIFRSSPTVFADTPVPTSVSTRILAGKPLRAMSSAAIFLHLYRGIGSSLIALSGPAEQRDERAPFHSITSSAAALRPCPSVRMSMRAARDLILVICAVISTACLGM